jgi:hypothetical protein
MKRALPDVTVRAWVVLAATVCTMAALAMPSLSASSATGPLTLAVMALAIAALLRFSTRAAVLATATGSSVVPHEDDVPLVLHGCVTDPIHHPVRPRAPGQA